MDGIAISHVNRQAPEYEQVLELREEILRRPLGLSLKNEDLSRDNNATIFIAKHNDKVIACLLLHRIDDETVQLKAMAVYSEWQGKGVGRELVLAAEQFGRENGYCKMMLHSRKVALGFYRSMEYGIAGDEFTEVGIPHYVMEKRIA